MIIAVMGRSIDPNGKACSMGSGKDTAADFIVKLNFAKVALADPMKRFTAEVYNFSRDQLWGPTKSRNAVDRRYVRKFNKHLPRGYAVICGRCFDAAFPDGIEEKTVGLSGPQVCQACGEDCLHGLTGYEARTPVELPVFLTPRHALQQLGTEWGRDCWQDTWVALGMKTARTLLADPHYFFYLPWEGIVERIGQHPQGEFEHDEAPPHDTAGVIFSDIRFLNEVKGIRARGGRVIMVERHVEQLPTDVDLEHQSEIECSLFDHGDFDAVVTNDGSLEDLEAKMRNVLEQLSRVADTERPPPIEVIVEGTTVGVVENFTPRTDPLPDVIHEISRNAPEVAMMVYNPRAVRKLELYSDGPPPRDEADDLADAIVTKLEEKGIDPTKCVGTGMEVDYGPDDPIRQEAVGVILDSRIIPEDNPLHHLAKAREADVAAGRIQLAPIDEDESNIPPFTRGKKRLTE